MTLRLSKPTQFLLEGEKLKKLFYSALDSKYEGKDEFKKMITKIVTGFNINLNNDLGHYTIPLNYLIFQRSPNVFEKVKILVELGADVNNPDINGLTPLYYSVMKFDYGDELNYLNRELLDVVKYLLDNGANPFYKPTKNSAVKRPLPFHEAAQNEYYESFNIIFENMTNWKKKFLNSSKETLDELTKTRYGEYLRWIKKEEEDCKWLQDLIDRIGEKPISKKEKEIFLKNGNIPYRFLGKMEILKNNLSYFDEDEIIKYMEKDKNTIIHSIDEKGNSLIIYGLMNNRKEIIRWFVLNELDLTRENCKGNSCFFVAQYIDNCLDEQVKKGEKVKKWHLSRWLNICIKERDKEMKLDMKTETRSFPEELL